MVSRVSNQLSLITLSCSFEKLRFKIVCRASTMLRVAFKRQKGKIITPEQNNAVERKYERPAAMSLLNIYISQ